MEFYFKKYMEESQKNTYRYSEFPFRFLFGHRIPRTLTRKGLVQYSFSMEILLLARCIRRHWKQFTICWTKKLHVCGFLPIPMHTAVPQEKRMNSYIPFDARTEMSKLTGPKQLSIRTRNYQMETFYYLVRQLIPGR